MEAVKTNIIGADNVITACVVQVKSNLLSTDKAAYQLMMGMSKA